MSKGTSGGATERQRMVLNDCIDLFYYDNRINFQMLCLSQTTGYAVHALSCINDGCKPKLIREIATRTGIRKPYLAKIINQLVHNGLVLAKRGHGGGVALARPPAQVSLLEIVKAVEGEQWMGPCLLGMGACTARQACPTQGIWQNVRREIEAVLTQTTLAHMIQALNATRPVRGVSTIPPHLTAPHPAETAGRRPFKVPGTVTPSAILRHRAPLST